MTRVFLVSGARLHRDGLRDALARWFDVVGTAADVRGALGDIAAADPDVVLLDGDAEHAVAAVRAVVAAAPEARVIAVAMPEAEAPLIALAEAGIAGYVPRDGSIDDLLDAVRSACCDEMRCSPRMAATLLHRVRALAAEHDASRSAAQLTRRQLEIVALVEEGLTNKEIAARLCIELPTVKNHLHTIYARLDVRRRAEAAAIVRGEALPGHNGSNGAAGL